jgi:hypothetical protein
VHILENYRKYSKKKTTNRDLTVKNKEENKKRRKTLFNTEFIYKTLTKHLFIICRFARIILSSQK